MRIEDYLFQNAPLAGGSVLQNPAAAVQKSASMLSLWNSPLTLAEFKILDAYLARIDSHHPENRRVRFCKGELEQILDVDRIHIKELRERIRHLGVMVEVEDFEEQKGVRSVGLFEEAVCYQDEDGLWQIDLECTQKAMKYIFHIEDLGHLRYKLHSIIHLTSRYSYLLFLYLERNRYRESWEASIEELRAQLGCGNSEMEFKHFHHNVLKKAKKELEEKTECYFSYELIRRGRRVRRIRFSLNPIDTFVSASPNAEDDPVATPPASEVEIL